MQDDQRNPDVLLARASRVHVHVSSTPHGQVHVQRACPQHATHTTHQHTCRQHARTHPRASVQATRAWCQNNALDCACGVRDGACARADVFGRWTRSRPAGSSCGWCVRARVWRTASRRLVDTNFSAPSADATPDVTIAVAGTTSIKRGRCAYEMQYDSHRPCAREYERVCKGERRRVSVSKLRVRLRAARRAGLRAALRAALRAGLRVGIAAARM